MNEQPITDRAYARLHAWFVREEQLSRERLEESTDKFDKGYHLGSAHMASVAMRFLEEVKLQMQGVQ